MNGDEEGVDCGGSCEVECECMDNHIIGALPGGGNDLYCAGFSPSICEMYTDYDDEDFTNADMCCICGGGIKANPSMYSIKFKPAFSRDLFFDPSPPEKMKCHVCQVSCFFVVFFNSSLKLYLMLSITLVYL